MQQLGDNGPNTKWNALQQSNFTNLELKNVSIKRTGNANCIDKKNMLKLNHFVPALSMVINH